MKGLKRINGFIIDLILLSALVYTIINIILFIEEIKMLIK